MELACLGSFSSAWFGKNNINLNSLIHFVYEYFLKPDCLPTSFHAITKTHFFEHNKIHFFRSFSVYCIVWNCFILEIITIMGFRTIVFIFIVIFVLRPSSGVRRTTSFIESTGVTCSDPVNYNWYKG